MLFLCFRARLTGVGFYPGVYGFFAPVLVSIGYEHFQVHVVGWLSILGVVANYVCVAGGSELVWQVFAGDDGLHFQWYLLPALFCSYLVTTVMP